MSEFKPTKSQRRVIDQIAQHGYILESDLRKPTRKALYTAGIIYYDLVRVSGNPDSRGLAWPVSRDAYFLTEKGKAYVSKEPQS